MRTRWRRLVCATGCGVLRPIDTDPRSKSKHSHQCTESCSRTTCGAAFADARGTFSTNLWIEKQQCSHAKRFVLICYPSRVFVRCFPGEATPTWTTKQKRMWRVPLRPATTDATRTTTLCCGTLRKAPQTSPCVHSDRRTTPVRCAHSGCPCQGRCPTRHDACAGTQLRGIAWECAQDAV